MNALNINSCHALPKSLQLANLTTYTVSSLFSLQVELAPRLFKSLVTLARPSVSSSFRQPHSVHSSPGSPHPAHVTSSQSPPSLSLSVTPSTFHRLKTHLFHKSFPLSHSYSLRIWLHLAGFTHCA